MNGSRDEDLKARTNKFARDIIQLCSRLPKETVYEIFSREILESSGSIGKNLRASIRVKSTAEFIARLKLVQEGADEIVYYLELLLELVPNQKELIEVLQKEAHELVGVFSASIKLAKKNALII